MQVSLRKAAHLANKLISLNHIERVECSVNAFNYPETYQEKFLPIVEEVTKSIDLRNMSITMGYEMRREIEKVKLESGVSEILNALSETQKMLSEIQKFQRSMGMVTDDQTVQRKIMMMEKDDDRYMFDLSVSPKELEEILKANEKVLLKLVEELQDKLTHKNFVTEVEIPKHIVDYLRLHDLL